MTLFLIALREGLEYGAILLLLTGVFSEQKKTIVASGVFAVASGVILTILLFPISGIVSSAYTAGMFYGFILLLLMSLITGRSPVYPVLAVIFALLLPSAHLTAVIFDEMNLKGWTSFFSAAGGFAISGGIFFFSLKTLPVRALKKFFSTNGVMAVLASFCFVFGGLNEFDNAVIITTLQKGIFAFLQSFMPFFRHLLLIPHGNNSPPALEMIVGFFASQRVAMALTALILFVPPLMIFSRLIFTPEPGTEGIEKKADRRKILSAYLNELLRKGTPLISSLIVSIVLLHAANLAINPTYDPEPEPVMAEGDTIKIPLMNKAGDISDGKLRKYSFAKDGSDYIFIIMMKPDGEVVAVLDACEVCPPRGYVQKGSHVICKYCNTPIPLDTLGHPGGCNPIPVRSIVENDSISVKASEIISAYLKEAGKETGSVLR